MKYPEFFAKRLFLKKVADAFTRVYESYLAGIIRRLAVSMPPRKSKCQYSNLFYELDVINSIFFRDYAVLAELRYDKMDHSIELFYHFVYRLDRSFE